MQIKTITLRKEVKKGLPNFSNITASVEVTIAVDAGEKPNTQAIWVAINNQLTEEVNKTIVS